MLKTIGLQRNSIVVKALLVIMASLALVLFYNEITPTVAEAAFEKINVNGKGVKPETGNNAQGFFNQANNLLYIVLAFGGFWVVACIIFAGVKLSSAQGNPQNRTQGFIGLAMALLGGFVVYKALDLAGWVAGLG